jgi:CheY-like chemotaxis protein
LASALYFLKYSQRIVLVKHCQGSRWKYDCGSELRRILFLDMQKQEAYKTLTKEQERFWKRILIVDDDADTNITFKAVIEDSNNDGRKRIQVHTANNPAVALSEFKPHFYDLLLVDINMPNMNGFELSEKILAIDINAKVCFMSSAEINREALREIYPTLNLGCFIRKPVTIDYLLKWIRSELD